MLATKNNAKLVQFLSPTGLQTAWVEEKQLIHSLLSPAFQHYQ